MLFPLSPPPAMPPRVVVTGAGIVTALGIGWKPNAEGFRAGRLAFRPVSHFDVSRQRVKVAAEVDLPDALPPTGLSSRQVARLDRAGVRLLQAAYGAWQQAQWQPTDSVPLVLGTTAGGMSLGEAYYRQAVQMPCRHRQQPTRAIHYQAQVQGRMVLDALGFDGPITIISNACASGSNAIGHAWDLIRRGHAKSVLAGGYDALSQLVFSGFDALQALSHCLPSVRRPARWFGAGRRRGSGGS